MRTMRRGYHFYGGMKMKREIFGNYTLSQMSLEELQKLYDEQKENLSKIEYFMMKKREETENERKSKN